MQSLVPADKLLQAIESLPAWPRDRTEMRTSLSWVNWRSSKGAQIKLSWRGCSSFLVFIDVLDSEGYGNRYRAREALLEAAFKQFADEGAKPRLEHGHGWTAYRWDFTAKRFVTPQDITAIAEKMGIHVGALYVQECISGRHAFDILGIPLVPGENGKEFVGGEWISYSTPLGKCL